MFSLRCTGVDLRPSQRSKRTSIANMDYVHRIGRTGRAGRTGKAVMISTQRDHKNLEAIEKLIQKEIPRIENPSGSEDERKDEKPSRSVEPRSSDSLDETVDKKQRGPKGRRRSRHGQDQMDQVVGMGDHLPSFIALSFEQRMSDQV